MLQHSRAPSRWYAEGLFIGGDGTLLGAAGVPSGVAEIEEAEVGLLFPQCLREDAQRLLRRVAFPRRRVPPFASDPSTPAGSI